MKKPIIGISANILKDQSGSFAGYQRAYVNEDYVISVLKNGGVPFIIPINQNSEVIQQQIEQIDGLILTGGYDVDPHNYHEEPLEKLEATMSIRDEFEFTLIKLAVKKKIPILGICRGIQIINTFYGGTLYQDLSYRQKITYRHYQGDNPTQVTHTIKIEPHSKLAAIFHKSKFLVNSFHHQIIKQVAPNFTVAARAGDGVIEGIEANDYPYLIGIQWHPEMLHTSVPEMNQQIFGSLIKKAKTRK